MPWAEAVAIKGKEIVFVGDNASAAAFAGENTNQIDLACIFSRKQAISREYRHQGVNFSYRSSPVLASEPYNSM